MRKNVLILEDNEAHMEALQKLVSETAVDLGIHAATNEHSAYRIAMENHIHVFLVDIILNAKKPGDVSGINFAQNIREIKRYQFTPLIFITSLTDSGLYSYSHLHCYRYIEKPFNPEQVKDTVRKALEFPVHADEERMVYFRKDGILYAKRIGDIIYIESVRGKSVIHCTNDTLEIPYRSIDSLLREMDSVLFFRCNRRTAINGKYIDRVDYVNRYVKLKNVPGWFEIGSSMKKKFKEWINRK